MRAVLDLATLATQNGVDVTILTTDAADRDTVAAGSTRVVEVDRRQLVPVQGRALEVLQSADAVHLHNFWNPELLPIARAGRRLGCAVVLSPHGTLDDWSMTQSPGRKRLFLGAIGRRVVRAADRIHFTAERERDQARARVGDAPSRVLPLPVDLTQLATAGEFVKQGDLVLFLSRIHPKKGLDVLVDAFPHVLQERPDARLVIAGAGQPDHEADVRARVARTPGNDSIRLLGHVGGEDRRRLLAEAGVLVLPTRQENFGYAPLEALASGTAVVTTDGVDISGELEQSGAATIVPLQDLDPRRLAAAILGTLGIDPPTTVEAAARVRAWVGGDLWERYEDLYSATADTVAR